MSSVFENPPDLLAVAGAYSSPGKGGACVGVLTSPTDPSLSTWRFSVYQHYAEAKSSLTMRSRAIGNLLVMPPESDDGFGRMKASYDRIRSLDAPSSEAGVSSLVMNKSDVAMAMLTRHLKTLDDKALDLAGFVFQIVEQKDARSQVTEWTDCLYSVLIDDRLAFAGGNIQTALDEIQSLEIDKEGHIKTASPLLMALVYSVGRAEWMAQTGTMPIQQIMRRGKRA